MGRLGLALAAVAAALLLGAPGAGAAGIAALRTPSLWIARAGEPAAIAARAQQAGVRTLLVKAADGTSPDPQFTPALVSALRASALTVCAWTFAYGAEPAGEAAAALAAVRAGAQCLVVDAEGQYDSSYGPAQAFVHALRGALGGAFPIALAGQAETLQHPQFPYSVFLGPGAFQLDMPQMYWRDLGLTVPGAYSVAVAENALYGRPIVPVGQLYGGVSAPEVGRFATLAAEYGAGGASFFDLDSAEPAQLAAVVPHVVPAIKLASRAATVRPGADGDEVLWAQELLDGAGAHLPIGGFFGAQTERAVAGFQARHRLRRSGILDAATWRALTEGAPARALVGEAPAGLGALAGVERAEPQRPRLDPREVQHGLVPGIGLERRPHGGLVLGAHDVQRALAFVDVAHGAADHDDALLHEPVHERGMLLPAVLFATPTRGIVPRSPGVLDDEQRLHPDHASAAAPASGRVRPSAARRDPRRRAGGRRS